MKTKSSHVDIKLTATDEPDSLSCDGILLLQHEGQALSQCSKVMTF